MILSHPPAQDLATRITSLMFELQKSLTQQWSHVTLDSLALHLLQRLLIHFHGQLGPDTVRTLLVLTFLIQGKLGAD